MSSNNCRDFFSWFEVIYGQENLPDDSVGEINGQSADINKGFGGEYVHLRPHEAERPDKVVDKIFTTITFSALNQADLAKCAGGDYRYFQWSNNIAADQFITNVALWRTNDAQEGVPVGWQGKTGDINKGRGGDYLYLVYQVKHYTGPQ